MVKSDVAAGSGSVWVEGAVASRRGTYAAPRPAAACRWPVGATFGVGDQQRYRTRDGVEWRPKAPYRRGGACYARWCQRSGSGQRFAVAARRRLPISSPIRVQPDATLCNLNTRETCVTCSTDSGGARAPWSILSASSATESAPSRSVSRRTANATLGGPTHPTRSSWRLLRRSPRSAKTASASTSRTRSRKCPWTPSWSSHLPQRRRTRAACWTREPRTSEGTSSRATPAPVSKAGCLVAPSSRRGRPRGL
jgi:hypothetical protein